MVNRLLSRLLVRELRKNWFEYLSMFLITVLAVTLFLGFLSNSATLRRRAALYYERANLADLVVQTTGLSTEDRERIEALAGADATVEYRVYSDGSFRKGDMSPETAKLFVSDGTLNVPYITQGEAGVLIDDRVAALRGYRIGDTIALDFKTFEASFAAYGMPSTIDAEITGFMHSVEAVNIYSVSPVFLTEQAAIDKLVEAYMEQKGLTGDDTLVRSLVRLVLPRMQTQAVVKTADPPSLKAKLRSYFDDKGEASNLVILYDHDTMEAVVTIDAEAEQSLKMIYVFPVIFFLVALLVLMTTVGRLVLRERTRIGTLRALGIPDGRIVVHYATLSACVTLIGCAVGAVLGPVIVPRVMSIKYGLMFSMPFLAGIAVDPWWTLGTVAVVCLCAFAIGMLSSASVMREAPAACMRPRVANYSPRVRGRREGLGGSGALLSLKMAMRNIRIGWRRAVMTVVGIAGCSALLLTSFGIGDTLQASVFHDYGNLFTYDVSASYTAETADALETLRGDPAYAIEKIEVVDSYIVSVGGRDLSVYVLPPQCEMTSVVRGRNALSEAVAEDLGVHAGDTLALTFGGQTREIEVEALVTTSAMRGFFVIGEVFSAAPPARTVWVRTSRPSAVAAAINDAVGNTVAQTMEQRVAEIENIISSTDTMKYTLMVFAVLLSVVVLYNLSLLNVKERTRDLATMKVLGFSHYRIALSLLFEILFLTVVGTAIGCAAGLPLLTLVMKINEVSVLTYIIALRPISYLITVLISLGTSAAINLVFGAIVRNISMTESLKSVE